MQKYVLGDAPGGAADYSSHMRSVAVAIVPILAIADVVVHGAGTAAEFNVRRANAGVDDVCMNARAGRYVIVAAAPGHISLIDAVEVPRRVQLAASYRDRGVRLDKKNIIVIAHCRRLFGRHFGNKSFQSAGINHVNTSAVNR